MTDLLVSVHGNLWCYSCVSSQPGCDDRGVDWLIHSAITCPKAEDKCVKIIERNQDEVQITRDCLSNLIGQRPDLPEDSYEGCRPAAKPNIAVYVQNGVDQLNLKRDYYKEVEFCYCEFDEWCNSATALATSWSQVLIVTILTIVSWLMLTM